MPEALKELGKQFLNIGVAILIFVIIQPFATQKLNTDFIIKGFIAYVLITTGGFILIKKGKELEEKE